MFTTGDNNLSDDRYTGAFTLNQYGLPGAVWFNHKMLILFPFTSTANNYTGAVTDISNQGYGLRAGIATGAHGHRPQQAQPRSWARAWPRGAARRRGGTRTCRAGASSAPR